MRRHMLFPTILAGLVTLSAPVLAQDAAGLPPIPPAEASGTYQFDPEHSHIVWSYQHMGFSTSHGSILGVAGTLVLDGADPSKSTVEASFPLSTMKSVSPLLDKDLMAEQFFNNPAPDTAITFTSTKVEPGTDNTATVSGDLTLNGQTKPVVLDVRLNQIAVSPIDKLPTAGFSATTTVKRSDFGLGAFAPAVSDEVQIEINVEAKKH